MSESAFQSDIGSSDIKLSPISLISNISLSAHLYTHALRIFLHFQVNQCVFILEYMARARTILSMK
jgi:hypothetical protein